MATSYTDVWNQVLSLPGTQNVDVIASINESGINHYLQRHHINDSLNYTKTLTKKFNTHGDLREFTIKLTINSPLQVQFPPYKNPQVTAEYINKDKWYKLDADHEGPQISSLQDPNANKIQVFTEKVGISISWPKLHPTTPNETWSFDLKSLNVFAEAFAILNSNQDGYYVSLIPTIIKFDVTPDKLSGSLLEAVKSLPTVERALADECQEKLTDLFVIALNVLATEQAPKLIRNIRVPVPIIKDRQIMPAALVIDNNCLTVGGGIDKTKAEIAFREEMSKESIQLHAAMQRDLDDHGGLTNMVSKNSLMASNLQDIELLTEEEIKKRFVHTNKYIASLKKKMREANRPVNSVIKANKLVDDAYAVGINEYFFNSIISSVIPAPKHECSGWLDLKVVRGRACYWINFYNPLISVNTPPSITGGMSIDIGGSIEACIRKFWDCSWRWECGSLALAVKGRPNITISLINGNDGVKINAKMGGNLYLDVNVPFPFNKIINAVTGVIGTFVIAMINIVLKLVSFYVIYPDITLPGQRTKLKLRDFNSFNYNRPAGMNPSPSKGRFIGFKGGLIAEV